MNKQDLNYKEDVEIAEGSKRVYKESYSHEISLGIITQGRGSHFDPLLADLFLEDDSSFRDIFDGTLAGKE